LLRKERENSLFFKKKQKKKNKRTYEMYADDIFRVKVQPDT